MEVGLIRSGVRTNSLASAQGLLQSGPSPCTHKSEIISQNTVSFQGDSELCGSIPARIPSSFIVKDSKYLDNSSIRMKTGRRWFIVCVCVLSDRFNIKSKYLQRQWLKLAVRLKLAVVKPLQGKKRRRKSLIGGGTFQK